MAEEKEISKSKSGNHRFSREYIRHSLYPLSKNVRICAHVYCRIGFPFTKYVVLDT